MARVYRRKKRKLRPAATLMILVIACIIILVPVLIFSKDSKPSQSEYDKGHESPSDVSVQQSNTNETDKNNGVGTNNDDETRLSFVAAGDNIIHEAVFLDAKAVASRENRNSTYWFDGMYSNFENLFKTADISFINQETMIAGDDFPILGYPSFNSPAEIGETLERLGVDVVNIGTNHSFDLGGKGLVNCIDFFKNTSITAIGAYTDREDYNNIRVIEKDGVKIAFLSYTFGSNNPAGAGWESVVLPIINESEMKRQAALAKELADFVFVSMHWGVENSFTVSSAQKEAAQVLVDAGVDVIIGTHPHVIQEMKFKDRPDGGRTLIIYSLGNFLSTQHPASNLLGGLVTLDIVKDESGCYIENPKFIPTMTHYSLDRDGLCLYRLEDYSEALYQTNGTSIRQESAGWSYNRLVKTVKNTIPEEFLEDWVINY